jgi:hypothetical protein
MKRLIFILTILTIFACSTTCKNLPEETLIDSIFQPALTGKVYIEPRNLDGDQYNGKTWELCKIIMSDGRIKQGEKLKYNGYIDEFIWLNRSNYAQIQIDKSTISDVYFTNQDGSKNHYKLINLRDEIEDKRDHKFVEVLQEDTFSAYVLRRVPVIGTKIVYKDEKMYEDIVIKAKPVYLIKTDKGDILRLNKLRKKTFITLFPQKKKELSKLLRVNHIDIREESGFAKAVQMLENLL